MMEGGSACEVEGKNCGQAAAVAPEFQQLEGEDGIPVQLSKALNISDLCSETGSVFEVSRDQQEEDRHSHRTFFDDDAVINSLKLGAGNCWFSDEDHSSSDEDVEPFEKLAGKMEDMTGDGGVLKMEVRAGVGGDMPSKASVVFHYSAYLEYSDEPFDSSHLRNKPEKKIVDGGDMMPGLNVAIKTMRKGEIARFLVRPQYAFGKLGCLPRIPGGETILYEVNMISFVDRAAADAYEELDDQAQSSATFQEKLEAARGYHRQGNEQYREGCIAAARSAYFRASWIMENARLQDEAEEVQKGSFLAKMRSNLAQVFLDLKEPARACTQCKLGLSVSRGRSDDILAKLYYRFGKAKAMLNDFKGARNEFQHAQRLKPNNTDIGKELESLLHREMKYTAKERFMCQRMFSSLDNAHALADDNKLASTTTSELKKGANHNSVLPNITPEFERIVEDRISCFTTDPNVSELPFPSMLSYEEIAYITAAAKAANLSIHLTHKGMGILFKVVKNN